MTIVVPHPHRELVAEAKGERAIVNSPEAQALMEKIFDAVQAYSDFLDRHELVCDYSNDYCRLKASALVVTINYGYDPGTIDITLKNGACDRVFGNGTNPDPDGRGIRTNEGAMTLPMPSTDDDINETDPA